MSETQPGGIYLVGGKLVDAEGKPTTRKGAEAEPRPKTFDAAAATKSELEAEAQRRGIEVKRGDGKEGEPLVDDFRVALS